MFLLVFKYVLFVLYSGVLGEAPKFTLTSNYNMEEIPPSGEDPLLISASINLRNILQVSETNQQISLETTLRFYWRDTRITPTQSHMDGHDSLGAYVNLHPQDDSQLWMPDTFIDQAINIRKPAYYTETASLRLYNDSMIRYSKRMNFDVACPMDFHKFPLDQQVCQVKFESFSLSTDQIQFKWMAESKNLSQYNEEITLDQFLYAVELIDNKETSIYDISYPRLIMQITLDRILGYHLLQTYMPSGIFVILAWLSFFLPPSSVPGRVAMGMITILTLTVMWGSCRENVPKVSYLTYVDIWVVMCLVFVNFCMFEFVAVALLNQLGKERTSVKMEKMCRIVFPVIFVMLTILYWIIIFTV